MASKKEIVFDIYRVLATADETGKPDRAEPSPWGIVSGELDVDLDLCNALHHRYRHGRFGYPQYLNLVAKAWGTKKKTNIIEATDAVPILGYTGSERNPMLAETFDRLELMGYVICLASTLPDLVTRRIAERAGINTVHILGRPNRVESGAKGLISGIRVAVDNEKRARYIMARWHVDFRTAVTVGATANCEELMRKSNTSLAPAHSVGTAYANIIYTEFGEIPDILERKVEQQQ